MPSRINELWTEDSTYDLPEKEAWKAWQRIGITPERIVRWALGWLNNKPASDDMWLALRTEIGALGSMNLVVPAENWSEFIQSKITKSEEPQFRTCLPSQKEATRFLSVLADCVEQLAQGSGALVGPLSVSVSVTRRGQGRAATGQRGLMPRPVKLADEAIYKVLRSLDYCGGLVACCPECNALFLADRTNQKYCNTRCQSVVTSRKFRQKPKKKSVKRRKKARERNR